MKNKRNNPEANANLPKEDEKMIQMHIRIPLRVKRRLEEIAKNQWMGMSMLVRSIIREYLNKIDER